MSIKVKITKADGEEHQCSICHEHKISYVDIVLQFPSRLDAYQIEHLFRDEAFYGNFTTRKNDCEIKFQLCEYDFQKRFLPVTKKAEEKVDPSQFPLEFSISDDDFKEIVKQKRWV